ncbi:hypothetical protein SAMN00768000_0263 [Sulfobacillus thermosulfidooxidans DSM 9293]|uniref:Uncharacterized protein n=1 Tax=Sulfobacillus thermosulfidooxidans (strain DSM 9293 / VKM B-1269 / AT-1) TaxID=929705 RepID=A0A1W1W779_SULTA|nr:hypothetical protein [Sulfobacillus thermosulfidooxidans]SMC02052.1 hypothetical protein SAMN00768000_0263 [Sulfobacillus thermosulfidooxidans DSM 9293]
MHENFASVGRFGEPRISVASIRRRCSQPYATYWHNLITDAYFWGHYFATREEAEYDFPMQVVAAWPNE